MQFVNIRVALAGLVLAGGVLLHSARPMALSAQQIAGSVEQPANAGATGTAAATTTAAVKVQARVVAAGATHQLDRLVRGLLADPVLAVTETDARAWLVAWREPAMSRVNVADLGH